MTYFLATKNPNIIPATNRTPPSSYITPSPHRYVAIKNVEYRLPLQINLSTQYTCSIPAHKSR